MSVGVVVAVVVAVVVVPIVVALVPVVVIAASIVSAIVSAVVSTIVAIVSAIVVGSVAILVDPTSVTMVALAPQVISMAWKWARFVLIWFLVVATVSLATIVVGAILLLESIAVVLLWRRI